MGKVIAVCISEKKGTQKHPVEEAEFVEGCFRPSDHAQFLRGGYGYGEYR